MSWQIMEALKGADGKAPSAFRIRLIKAGVSLNGNDYPLRVLHEAAPLFDGVRIRVLSDEDHSRGRKGSVRDLVGWISDVTPDGEGLVGTANISESANWLAVKMNDALARGHKSFIGFSMVAKAYGKGLRSSVDGAVRRIDKFARVDFVDAVVDPSAGGEVMGLAESINTEDENMNREKLLKLIEAKAPALYGKLDPANLTDEQLLAALTEAIDTRPAAEQAGAPAATVDVTEAVKLVVAESLGAWRDEVMGKVNSLADAEAERLFDNLFTESKLPEESRKFVKAEIPADKVRDAAAIREAIDGHRKYLAGQVGYRGAGSYRAPLDVNLDETDKHTAALDGFFLGEAVAPEGQTTHQAPFVSIREAYIQLTGDERVTGRIEDCRRINHLSEAVIQRSTWTSALRDAMHKALLREYKLTGLDQWKQVADIVPVSDFRTNYRYQMGGFSNLATVSETGAYQDFTTAPGHFEPSYAVTKYGNLQPITLETIVNDDAGFVRRLPGKMARAAMRTVSVAAWAPILTNANVTYEAVALFHATHGANLGSGALAPATIQAGRLAMRKQPEPGSSDRLMISPKWLVVPVDLEQTAFELCYSGAKPLLANGNTNAAAGTAITGTSENAAIPNFYQQFNLEPLVIPHATDVNDWFMAADRRDIPLMEVGFLGGRQEPELFVADNPSQGSLFTNDQINYKVRLIFGVAVLDHRGWYGAIVA